MYRSAAGRAERRASVGQGAGVIVPPRSREVWLASFGERARAWMDRLPDVVALLLDRWSCVVEGQVRAGYGGVVMPVRRADGARAVLKMTVPHESDDFESVILATWAGRGAVLMLEHDDAHRALLLEELDDTSLADIGDAERALTVVGRLARRLAVPAPAGPPKMSEACARWAVDLPVFDAAVGHPLPARVVDAAVATCRELGPDQPGTLLHGDLHQHNVLRGTREEWLVIDPLGGIGEIASECLTHLRDRYADLRAQDDPSRALRRRIDVFAEAAEIDPVRARR